MVEKNEENIFNNYELETKGAAPGGGSFWDSTGGKIQILLDVVLVILAGANLFWLASVRNQFKETAKLQTDQLTVLARRADASDEGYAQVSGELKVTTDKLGMTAEELNRARAMTASIKKQQQEAVKRLDSAIAEKASAEEVNSLQSDTSQKFDNLSGDIAKTQEALTGTKSELSGDIARTHDELVALAHRTDRDYFEFSLSRKRARQKFGGVAIELAKTNPKRNQFTVNLYFDDKRVLQKDKALMEPVQFYVRGASSALELVVNQVGKDRIAGYLSTPKSLYAGVPNVLSERPVG